MIKQILGNIPRKPSDSNPPKPATISGEAGPTSVSHEPLPSFREVPSSEKLNLFIKKLSLCNVVFDFTGPPSSPAETGLREKDIKRQTLLELVDHIASIPRFDEALMLEITKMAAANLFRTFPAPENCGAREELDEGDGGDDDEDDPWVEPAWTHIQIVYELLLRFVASPQTDPKLAKRFIDRSFVLRLLELFESEDPRERDYLKTILHRVYGKFTVHRPFLRKAINNVFYRFVLETQKRNGVGELLELYSSVIEGFALPLKEEHKLFLSRALLPLHKPKSLALYQRQLLNCVARFLEKDPKLSEAVISGLLKYWPLTNSSKELVFLGELEEVLEATQGPEFKRCLVPLFKRIARCINSFHFQVAERTLLLWNNDHIRNLMTENCEVVLPIILPALESNIVGHWNQSIQSLSLNVRKIFEEADQGLFEECLEKFKEAQIKEKDTKEKRELKWKRLEEEVGFSEAISSFVSSVAVSNC